MQKNSYYDVSTSTKSKNLKMSENSSAEPAQVEQNKPTKQNKKTSDGNAIKMAGEGEGRIL